MLAIGWDDLNPMNWVSDAVGGAVDAVFEGLVDAVMAGVHWIAQQIAAVFVEAGKPRFGSDMLSVQSGLMWMALVAVIATVTVSMGIAVVKPSATSLADSLVELPMSVVLVLSCFSLMNIWLRFTQAVSDWILTDTVKETFSAGMEMDTAIVPWVRFILGILLVIFFVLFLVEQLIMGHLIAVTAALMPLGIGVRPLRQARYLSRGMLMMFLALSTTPMVMALSLRIALSNYTASGPLDFLRILGALTGVAITTLMPFLVFKLFPIGNGSEMGGLGLGAVMGGAMMASQATNMVGGMQRSKAAGGATGGIAGAGVGGPGGGGPGPGGGSPGGGGPAGGGGGGAAAAAAGPAAPALMAVEAARTAATTAAGAAGGAASSSPSSGGSGDAGWAPPAGGGQAARASDVMIGESE